MAMALAFATGNAAADGLPSKGRIADTSHADAPPVWTGIYVGLNAGLASGNTQGSIGRPDRGGDNEPTLARIDEGSSFGGLNFDYEMNGALYGAQIGYLHQRGNLVLGVEASLSGSSIQGSDAGCLVFIAGIDCRRDVNWLATVVGRAGWAYDRILLYGLAGVAWADVDTSAKILNQPFLSGGDTHVGWTVGFGLEWALSNRVSARIEYAHIDLGSQTHNLRVLDTSFSVPDRVDLEIDTIRLGVNVKLGNN
jgi:outer membrane immunogenic protein